MATTLRHIGLGLGALALLGFAAACDEAGADGTPIPQPTATVRSEPTATPAGTPIVSPTATATATAPAPTATPGAGTAASPAPTAPPFLSPPATPIPVSTAAPAPPPLASDRQRVRAPIEGVNVRVAESAPPQYFAEVVSELPGGCARFDHYTVARSGQMITIEVWNTMPRAAAACTAIYGYVQHNIALGSDFQPGVTYTLLVNGTSKTFTAQ